MVKYLILICLFLGSSFTLKAQSALVSDHEKVDYTLSHFELLGKQENRIFVLKYGQNKLQFRMYDQQLKFQSEKEFEVIGRHVRIEGIHESARQIEIFVSSKRHGIRTIQQFKVINGEVSQTDYVHQFQTKNFEAEKITTVQSQSGGHTYILKTDQSIGNGVNIDMLNTQSDQSQSIYWDEKNWEHIASEVTSNGRLIFLLEDRSINQSDRSDYMLLGSAKGSLFNLNIGHPDTVLTELRLSIDEKNNALMVVGLYSQKNEKQMEGIYVSSYELSNMQLKYESYIPYSKQLIKELTGKDWNRNRPYTISNLKMRDAVLKRDGGIILSVERALATQSGIPYPIVENNTLYDAIWQPETKTQFRYSTVMIFNLDHLGSLIWEQIIHKNQLSLDDDGVYSSFALLNEGNQLRYIFNETLGRQVRLHSFSLKGDGSANQEDIFNSDNREIILAPRYAKQIAKSEILIPSFTRQSFRLIKLNFK